MCAEWTQHSELLPNLSCEVALGPWSWAAFPEKPAGEGCSQRADRYRIVLLGWMSLGCWNGADTQILSDSCSLGLRWVRHSGLGHPWAWTGLLHIQSPIILPPWCCLWFPASKMAIIFSPVHLWLVALRASGLSPLHRLYTTCNIILGGGPIHPLEGLGKLLFYPHQRSLLIPVLSCLQLL